MDEENPEIVHLDRSAKCICAHQSDGDMSETSKFYIGTCSSHEKNSIQVIEYDDYENNVTKSEIDVDSKGLITKISQYDDHIAFIEDLNCYIYNLESQAARTLVSEATYSSVLKQNRLATLSKSYASIFDIADIESPTKIHLKNSLQTAFQHGELKFDTHSNSQLFATTGKNLDVYDLRSCKSTSTVTSNFQIRSFDINPNRTDYVTYVTDNRIISTVDVRNQKETISSTETGHNHWVWSVRYNPFHDRLVLTSGSDNRAILYTFFETCSDNVKKSNWQLTSSESFEDDLDKADDYWEVFDVIISKF